MKELTKQRIFFISIFILFSFSMINEALATASITILPTSGPIGTTIKVNGTGYIATQNNQQVSFGLGFSQELSNLNGNVWLVGQNSGATWTLPVGAKILYVGIPINNTGSGSGVLSYGSSFSSPLNNLVNTLRAVPGTNGGGPWSLPAGTLIDSIGVPIGTQAGYIDVKIYNATSTGGAFGEGVPTQLLGDSGPKRILGSGVQYFNLTATIGANGLFFPAYEFNSTSASVEVNTAARCYYSVPHTFSANQPNPFGTATGSCDHDFPVFIHYIAPTPYVRVKIYNTTIMNGNPTQLLGESNQIPINTTGLNYFPVKATVGPSGNIYGAYEFSSGFTAVKVRIPEVFGNCFHTHTFGTGPNPFPLPLSCQTSEDFPSAINYSTSQNNVTMIWDNDNIISNPSIPFTNSTGGFTNILINAPISLIGSHTVKANDSFGNTASKTFTITLPNVTSTISGNVQFGTSSVIPSLFYSGAPATLSDIQQILFANGSSIQTITNPFVTIFTGSHTNGNSNGELIPGPRSYYINTTMFDGANFWVVKSNTINLSNGASLPPSQGKQCSIDSCPAFSLVNYTVNRTPDFKTLKMTVNLQPIPFHIECNIVNGTFGNAHKWFNYTSVTFVNFTTHVPYSQNVYFACYGSGPILSGISPGNGTLIVQGANTFNQTLGVTLGVPIGTFFIAMLGSLANQRTGPIYVVVLLAAVGIMAAVLFFTIPSGAWALELITGFLGIFVGRKIF